MRLCAKRGIRERGVSLIEGALIAALVAVAAVPVVDGLTSNISKSMKCTGKIIEHAPMTGIGGKGIDCDSPDDGLQRDVPGTGTGVN